MGEREGEQQRATKVHHKNGVAMVAIRKAWKDKKDPKKTNKKTNKKQIKNKNEDKNKNENIPKKAWKSR
jgi:hypothetical protein